MSDDGPSKSTVQARDLQMRTLDTLERNAEAYGAQKEALAENTKINRENIGKIYDKVSDLAVGQEGIKGELADVKAELALIREHSKTWSDRIWSVAVGFVELIKKYWIPLLIGTGLAGGGGTVASFLKKGASEEVSTEDQVDDAIDEAVEKALEDREKEEEKDEEE